jgi:DNA-binding CsgD family transcriptional regulator/PAS domain-containing protein
MTCHTSSREVEKPAILALEDRAMEETAQLSNLIGNIYDAVLEPALWTGVLESVARFLGGSAATIFWQDGIRKEGNSYYNFGANARYEQLYFDKYIKFDPLSAAYFMLDVGEVTSNSMLIPPAEFFETRFYREWVQPQGWIDNVFAILERSATSISVFAAFRHERDGLADDNARRRLRLITPHLRRAVLIGKVIDLKADEAATFASMLDTLSAGIFLVDAAGRTVHENAAGRSILAAGDILRSAAGRLVARDPLVNQILHDAFKSAERGDAAIGAQGIAVPLIAPDGERHVAHLLNLTSGARRQTGIAAAATAALIVHKASMRTPSRPEAIAKAYKLTPTELRVLLALIEVGGGPEIAEALGIADGTVKTHLGHLFQKTGVKHQADLVKLVAGFSSPLID